MVNKSLKLASAVTTLILSASANAAIITHGYLTTDNTGSVITDTNTGREYLRFDEFDLTYAETVAAVSIGGIYEGWSIADSAVADEFYAAALGVSSTPCAGEVINNTVCGFLTGWVDGDFGESFSGDNDIFLYTNNSGRAGRGVIFSYTQHISENYNWYSLDGADSNNFIGPVNYLLYQDVSTVPVPAAVWLFGSGLIGLIGVARRKKV